jgi:hypothetical protein
MKKKIITTLGIMMSPFAGLMGSGTGIAHASPYPAVEISVCNTLANNSTEAGVKYLFDTVLYYIRTGQTTADQYSVIVADAINNRCPEYWPMVATYMANHPAQAAA